MRRSNFQRLISTAQQDDLRSASKTKIGSNVTRGSNGSTGRKEENIEETTGKNSRLMVEYQKKGQRIRIKRTAAWL